MSALRRTKAPSARVGRVDPKRLLDLHVHRPVPGASVVEVVGEVDLCTAPHLAEVVEARIRSTVGVVIIDLSRTTFLAVAGLKVLRRMQLLAQLLDTDFYVDPGDSHPARRLLQLMPLGCERPGAAAGLSPVDVPGQRRLTT
ncbi:STAS domain-containing protein [Amycolatopsis carbonis]|uniref:STAS domain-containing protein n=1 Tax=Amycolatopsis carbonis TaxID=715471 RepID=A0A9Y2MRT3_9PSEU|nr:STAS domain-containing protein [Amycolatopsis sp. 2-15]WIX75836.1 STAS domain-containing protein [Amycolatopsis sp. 2-15]